MVEHVLEVTSPLSVHIFPPQQLTERGSTAVFNCTVDGFPVLNVYWLKNGQILVPSSRVSPGTESLTIRGVGVGDRGQYQCVAGNEEEESQAAASLMLGGELIIEPCLVEFRQFEFLYNCVPKGTTSHKSF